MSSENERQPDEAPQAETPPAAPPDNQVIPPAEFAVELSLAEPSSAAHKPEESVAAKRTGGASLSLDDFILLNEEIAGMARAGLPLDQGLATMSREMGNGKLRLVMSQVAGDMHGGLTLPQAIERQAGRVPTYYSKLLAAGIRTGRMGEVISTLTAYARSLSDLRTMIINALVYPIIVLVLSVILFGVVAFYLMPMYRDIFTGFKIKIPLITRLVFDVYDNGIWFFVVLPAVLIGGVFAIRAVARSRPEWWRNWASFWYNFPIIGELLRSARLVSFTDLLGILVDNGVPLPEAFLLAGQASSDPLTAMGARQVHDGLSQGAPLGTVLHRQLLMPDMVIWMVGLGEKRGTLGPALHQVAEIYRRKVEMRIGLLRSLLPSFLIILIAGGVIVIHVFAMMAPLLSLIENLSGGGVIAK